MRTSRATRRWGSVGLATALGVAATSLTPVQAAPATFTREVSAANTARTYIVRFADSVTESEGELEIRGRGGSVTKNLSRVFKGAIVKMTPGQVNLLRKADAKVLWVEEDKPVSKQVTVSPVDSWGLDRIDQRALPLSNSYSYDTTGAGVDAYIVDTGILATHNQFGSRVRAGFDAFGGTTVDCHGHGSHVAGTVGGSTLGVAPNVNLVAIRVLDCQGAGTVSGVVLGIDWAIADHTTRPAVMNLSLGGSASAALDSAVTRARGDGIVVVGAAGNANVDACTSSPGSATGDALIVGATTTADARASFSNFGECLDLFAPGDTILSVGITSTTATAYASGTSMASPHVTGLVARYLSANPAATPTTAMAAIIADTTQGAVTSAGTLSPNRLAFAQPPAPSAATTTVPSAATTPAGSSTTQPGASTPDGSTTTLPGSTTTAPGGTTTVPGTTTTVPGTTTTAPGGTTTTIPGTTIPDVPARTSKPIALAGSQAAYLEWTEATQAALPITAHLVRVYRAGILVKTVRVNGDAVHEITGLRAGSTHTFAVANENGLGVGEFSPWSNSIVPLKTVKVFTRPKTGAGNLAPPNAPTGVKATRVGSVIQVTWRQPTNADAITYEIWFARSGKYVARVVTSANGGVRVFGLKRGRYTVRVRAVNTVGEGLLSQAIPAAI